MFTAQPAPTPARVPFPGPGRLPPPPLLPRCPALHTHTANLHQASHLAILRTQLAASAGAGASASGNSPGDWPVFHIEETRGPANAFERALHGALQLFERERDPVKELLESQDEDTDQGLRQAVEEARTVRTVYEVLQIDSEGSRPRKSYMKRRDLLRANALALRDLRRLDPSLSVTKTAPSITVKENCLLVNTGGVRVIVKKDRCLLFEPDSTASNKFLSIVTAQLSARNGARTMQAYCSKENAYPQDEPLLPPFELDMLEGALLVATGNLDEELVSVTRRAQSVLQRLPADITPVNLDTLRRVKQALVELESRADSLRDMLEQLMDDEDNIRDINLSSRPRREEQRRRRERERLERERESARAQSSASASMSGSVSETMDQEYLDELRKGGRAPPQWGVQNYGPLGGPGSGGGGSGSHSGREEWDLRVPAQRRDPFGSVDMPLGATATMSRTQDDEGYEEATAALEEMEEEEEEERDLDQVEDLLQYYLQRAATAQSEAERLLAGARDLEESIGLSLSARRFEVNRLDLKLSIGAFASGIGALIASVFGMNLKSTLEESVIGFWGMFGLIVLGTVLISWYLWRYTRAKRIL